MFNSINGTPIQRLTPELVLQLALCLDPSAVVALGLSCHQFADFVLLDKTGLVFRRLAQRDFGVTYITQQDTAATATNTWLAFYKDLHAHRAGLSSYCCAHLSRLPDDPSEATRVLYRAAQQTAFPCDFCHTDRAGYLAVNIESNLLACRPCLQDRASSFPIQLEITSGKLWCFKCERELGGDGVNVHEACKVKDYVDKLDMAPSLNRRRKAEHMLYIQELRREDMALRHYLVEKNWARAWMMFRTREGSPLPGKIPNQKLARSNGTLNPGIRLPNDKYRPSPETSADIISEKLWAYLSKAYGVQGKAFSEDDLQYPEYARLRAYIDDFKKSILAYP